MQGAVTACWYADVGQALHDRAGVVFRRAFYPLRDGMFPERPFCSWICYLCEQGDNVVYRNCLMV